jgi:probable rRNA maturation factor
MALPPLLLSLQFGQLDNAAVHRAALPRHAVTRWIRHALAREAEITVRIVDSDEGRALNRDYRHKDYATNVLTFDYSREPVVCADLVLCAPVVAQEAREQGKTAGALRPPAGPRHAARPGLGARNQRGRRAGHGSP